MCPPKHKKKEKLKIKNFKNKILKTKKCFKKLARNTLSLHMHVEFSRF
jgi:hypothetical protein